MSTPQSGQLACSKLSRSSTRSTQRLDARPQGNVADNVVWVPGDHAPIAETSMNTPPEIHEEIHLTTLFRPDALSLPPRLIVLAGLPLYDRHRSVTDAR